MVSSCPKSTIPPFYHQVLLKQFTPTSLRLVQMQGPVTMTLKPQVSSIILQMPSQADRQCPAHAGLVCNPVHMSCFWNCCRNRSRGQVTFRTCLQLSAPPWKHTCPLGMLFVETRPCVSPSGTTERKRNTAAYLVCKGQPNVRGLLQK